jgi:hypothetical protein
MTDGAATRSVPRVRRPPHENVATVLVDPLMLGDLELDLAGLDLWVWPVASAGIAGDGPRLAFQIRRRMLLAKRGAWDCALDWTPVWVSFGETWHRGAEPLPWAAHAALWDKLAEYADHTRYRLGLGGVPKLPVHRESRV